MKLIYIQQKLIKNSIAINTILIAIVCIIISISVFCFKNDYWNTNWHWSLAFSTQAIMFFVSFGILKERGCTKNKTNKQINEYFESLFSFLLFDIVFYNEQYEDLTQFEKDQFNKWILKHHPKK